MGIPYAMEYIATVAGAALKLVQCEKCQAVYMYRMERQVQSSETSWLFVDGQGAENRAAARARQQLEQTLEHDCDPVPCPECGCYQEPMFAAVRQRHRRWMFYLGVLLLAISCVSPCQLATVSAKSQDPTVARQLLITVLLVSLMGGISLIMVRKLQSMNWDPNSADQDLKSRAAKSRAIPKAHIDKLVQAAKSLAESLIGLTNTEAEAIAYSHGFHYQVVMSDGECYPSTTGFAPNRINVALTDGRVTKAYIG
ncbi:MAG: hypothetical protein JNM56_11750 [Planctomycetia bacterium]|nr:hypothetical protein [Planctomycetia bacterium]